MAALDGQLALFAPRERNGWPYVAPCPIRETCTAYAHNQKYGGGCGGEHGWCRNALKASGGYTTWKEE